MNVRKIYDNMNTRINPVSFVGLRQKRDASTDRRGRILWRVSIIKERRRCKADMVMSVPANLSGKRTEHI